ncbi:PepSY domain-containing protein [Gracilibacillus sp. HCP3S3_G5_1]|uniref:PepSY domain-containing protein n=1 Tax=unclassified Gracilibacillus TaxID=2625209 RepID=UPI003F8C0866
MKIKTFFMILTVFIIIGGGLAIYNFTSSPASAYLSKEEAEEKIANQFSGEITELELEEENNQKVYEVEIKGTDRDYELKIDAETGEILLLNEKNVTQKNEDTTNDRDNVDQQEKHTAKEDDHETEQQADHSNNTLISAEEARTIATNEYPGSITDFELDEDDGRYQYEIEIKTDNGEVDLEIDAYTGSIISISKDDFDDD